MSHSKQKLTIDEQIEHLKKKGVSFELFSEEAAKEYLQTKNHYFRLSAFRKLFPKFVGGERDGQYINLDFEHLRNLSYLDQELRSIILFMTLDIEHYEKVKLMSMISRREDEDGYSIVAEYKGSIKEKKGDALDGELSSRRNDTYCGNIISKYQNDMPVWAFLEVVSFGRFIDFCRFCSERWNDKGLEDEHYMLKKAKSLRNASAHGTCIINGFADEPNEDIRLPYQVSRSVSRLGMNKRLREKRLSNTRMKEIATLLYLYCKVVSEGQSKQRTIGSLKEFFRGFNEANLYEENSVVFSSVCFIERLTEGYGLS